ncbi:MAG: hypothetical protein PHP82_04305 [Candidatus ainarchaeum sp.]|nr:hypothetical protein [Candidatus ainarchaeum sp.]
MDLDNFVGNPCSSKTSFEFMPKQKTILDLEKISKKINNVEVKSKILLIIKEDDLTISIFRSGKILARGINDEKIARKIIEKILKKIK